MKGGARVAVADGEMVTEPGPRVAGADRLIVLGLGVDVTVRVRTAVAERDWKREFVAVTDGERDGRGELELDLLTDGLGEPVRVAKRTAVGETLGDLIDDLVSDGRPDGDVLLLGEGEAEGDVDGRGDLDDAREPEPERVALDAVCVRDTMVVAVFCAVLLVHPETDGVRSGERERVERPDAVTVFEAVTVRSDDLDARVDCVAVDDLAPDLVAETHLEDLIDGDALAHADGALDAEVHRDAAGERDGFGVPVFTLVAVFVPELVGVGELDRETRELPDFAPLDDGRDVREGDNAPLLVYETEAVWETVTVGTTIVAVLLIVRVGVGPVEADGENDVDGELDEPDEPVIVDELSAEPDGAADTDMIDADADDDAAAVDDCETDGEPLPVCVKDAVLDAVPFDDADDETEVVDDSVDDAEFNDDRVDVAAADGDDDVE